MHDVSVIAEPEIAEPARTARLGGRALLAAALRASRDDTLATFAAFERALPGLQVPQRAEFNPPLWELGHVGWFQSWWLQRNPHRSRGTRADPDIVRTAAEPPQADGWYHSSRVAHASRWQLPLPDAEATRADLLRQLEANVRLLADADDADDASLYFFRLSLLHEDMHHEAALYMARSLDVPVADPRWRAPSLPPAPASLEMPAGRWTLGDDPGAPGFAFDNELGRRTFDLVASEIDAQAVRWAEYLPFVVAGGYADPRWWDAPGRGWLAETGNRAPRYLRQEGRHWLERRDGHWQPLDDTAPACHLTRHEAAAWCRWAGRRLPTEAEWERAALSMPRHFRWGDVWEWTASPFRPFDGFVAHPYRDYSAPWFDGRPVLRGASYLTQPRMRHPRFRNFFPASRSDVPAGFRSCRSVAA